MQNKFTQLSKIINESNSFMLVGHVSPDGDAIGSMLAFYNFLKQKNKQANMFINYKSEEDYEFLFNFKHIKNEESFFLNQPFDALIIFDSCDIKHAGLDELMNQLNHQPIVVNIDHHEKSEIGGELNWVNEKASSVCEMVYDFFKFINFEIDQNTATSLLTGILYDTDFFVNANTTDHTLKTTAELIEKGARLRMITQKLNQHIQVKNLKLWGKIMARLNVDPATDLAVSAVFEDDFKDVGADENALNGLSNFLNKLSDVKGVMLLKEKTSEGAVTGSLRTRRDDFNVAKIAQQYGGGGHQKAAGFRIEGRVVKDKEGRWKVEKNK